MLNEGSTIEVDEEVEGSETSNLQDKNVVTVRSQYILPAISYKWLCERVMAEHGYRLVLPTGGIDEVLNDHRYVNAVMPFTRMESGATDMEWCTTKSVAAGTLQSLTDSKRYVFNSISGCFTGYRAHTDYYNPSRCRPRFVARATGTYVFEYSIRVPQNSSCYINFETSFDSPYNSQGTSERVISRGAVHQQPVTGTRVVELRQNQAVEFSFDSEKGTMQAEISIRCVKATFDGPVFPSTALPVALNLPDLTQADLITTLARLWCLTVEVNEAAKAVIFTSFDELAENVATGKLLDWSRKLHVHEHNTQFRWQSYGQRNRIAYRETDTSNDRTLTSEGYLLVNDTTLESEKNLFEVPFAATEETTVFGGGMAKIRYLTQGEVGGDVSARLLYLEEQNLSVKFVGLDSRFTISKDSILKTAFEPVAMPNFMSCYSVVQNRLLQRCRFMTLSFNLSPIDIHSYHPKFPVFIDRYSCCFYVNKISNYIPGRLTKVELVTIHPS